METVLYFRFLQGHRPCSCLEAAWRVAPPRPTLAPPALREACVNATFTVVSARWPIAKRPSSTSTTPSTRPAVAAVSISAPVRRLKRPEHRKRTLKNF
jgi:hypothetical protein